MVSAFEIREFHNATSGRTSGRYAVDFTHSVKGLGRTTPFGRTKIQRPVQKGGGCAPRVVVVDTKVGIARIRVLALASPMLSFQSMPSQPR